jgi:hypothetical protein
MRNRPAAGPPRRFSVSLAGLLLLVGLELRAAGSKSDAPVISCVQSTPATVAMRVCAPDGAAATGLAAGFSIFWISAAELSARGGVWPPTDDPTVCEAAFSGLTVGSRYGLAPGECSDVIVGDFLSDIGFSTDCPGPLLCGTDYVFRAFGHATRDLQASDFSENLFCSTLPCSQGSGCTFSAGYWKTHPQGWPIPTIALGAVQYQQSELIRILGMPVRGNGLIALAQQLIGAKLNLGNGAGGAAVLSDIAAADALIGDLVVPPTGGGYLKPSETSLLTGTLASFNEGAVGPGYCE